MIYVTTRQGPRFRQVSLWDDLFDNPEDLSAPETFPFNPTNTRTTVRRDIPVERYGDMIRGYISDLNEFNTRNSRFLENDLHDFYYSFSIPKRSGGLRRINAPNAELSAAQRELASLFRDKFGVLYHTSAFAYVKKRSTIDAIKRHQSNESRWFLKLDLHDFFGSTTPDFVFNMFRKIWPFAGIVTMGGGEALKKALSICFLDGGLPQGTPISPLLTNIMMIPIDHEISNQLRSFSDGQRNVRFVYTRYADDMLISSKVDFKYRPVIDTICGIFGLFSAPFCLNNDKTRYGSSAGSNWNLGVMLNKDNKITIGHKNKDYLRAMLCTYTNDRRGGRPWELSDVQHLAGKISYYKMVEPDAVDGIIAKHNAKFDVDVMQCIKSDLTP